MSMRRRFGRVFKGRGEKIEDRTIEDWMIEDRMIGRSGHWLWLWLLPSAHSIFQVETKDKVTLREALKFIFRPAEIRRKRELID